MRSNWITVDGISMRWEEIGEGFPVVLIHGIPTSPRLWRGVVPQVRGTRCLAWEMVGHGESMPEGSGRDISVGRQADYLFYWMQALRLEPPILVGHDLGGGVAQIFAVRHPGAVRGLLLVDSIAYDSWPIPRVKRLRSLGQLLERLPRAALHRLVASFIHAGHDDPAIARDSFFVHWAYYERFGGSPAFARQIRSLDVRDTLAITDRLPQLDLPARIVWGVDDPFQRLSYGERLAHDLKTTVMRIEGGKHFTPEDHPGEVASALNDLLEEVRARLERYPSPPEQPALP